MSYRSTKTTFSKTSGSKSGYQKSGSPKSPGSKPVYKKNCIKHHAYYNLDIMTSIIIPNSIVSIDNNSFRNCVDLEYVSIPDSVWKIEENAFTNCPKLEHVFIPDSVKRIGKEAFKDCSKLREVVLPQHTSIESDTFDETVKIIRVKTNPASAIRLNEDVPQGVNLSQTLRLELCDGTSTKVGLCKFINDTPYTCGQDSRPATAEEIKNGVPVYYSRKYIGYVVKDNKPLILIEHDSAYITPDIEWTTLDTVPQTDSQTVSQTISLTVSFTDSDFNKVNSMIIKPNTVFHITNQGCLMAGACEISEKTLKFGGRVFKAEAI